MRSIFRPITRSLALSLLVVTAGLSQPAAAFDGAAGETAPQCVEYAAGWRYAFVTNSCGSTQELTVRYGDGTEVPCRTVAPGDTVTFPGHGTRDDDVLGVTVCPGRSS